MIRALILVLGMLAAAIQATPAGAEPVVLHRGNVAEPDTLDPQKGGTTYEQYIARDLFEGLVSLDAAGETIPGIAERWDISEDGLTYTFHLRENLVWSDGHPLTADDVVLGFRRAMDPATGTWYANFGYKILNGYEVNTSAMKPEELGVRALDARTVEIRLVAPSLIFVRICSIPMFMPVPGHVYAIHGDDWVKEGVMVSNGAYTLASWKPQDSVRLVRNPRFFAAETVRIDEVIYYPTDDDEAALRRFRTGALDLNTRFPPSKYDWLQANLPAETRVYSTGWISYIAFNLQNPKFADVRVRRALTLAIDREAITGKILRTGELPAYTFVPPAVQGFESEGAAFITGVPPEGRMDEARRLLAEAGYGPDNPLHIVFNHRIGEANRRVSVAIQQMWREAGVEVELQANEVKIHYNLLREGSFEIADGGWSASPDAEYFIYLLLSNSTEVNYGRYSNAEYDRLGLEADRTMDLERRLSLYQQAEKIALEEVAMIPVYIPVERALVQTWVKGFVPNGTATHPTRFMWIERGPEIAQP